MPGSSKERCCRCAFGLDGESYALHDIGQMRARHRDDVDAIHLLRLGDELLGNNRDALLHEVIDLLLEFGILTE